MGGEDKAKILLQKKGLKIFNFHPIHIFLNSNDTKNYQKLKLSNKLHNQKELKKAINKKYYGTRNFLDELIKNAL